MKLVDLIARPEELERAEPRECADLLGELVRLETLVRLRIDTATMTTRTTTPKNGNDEGVFLLPEEAAEIARVDVKWLLRNTSDLPFRRQPTRKRIRFEEHGFRAWLKARR